MAQIELLNDMLNVRKIPFIVGRMPDAGAKATGKKPAVHPPRSC